jgi:hypothetical protein
VVEQNERNEQRRYHPNVPDEDRDNQFKQMEKSLNLSQRSVVKTYGKIQNRLNFTIPPVREDFDSSDSFGEGGI